MCEPRTCRMCVALPAEAVRPERASADFNEQWKSSHGVRSGLRSSPFMRGTWHTTLHHPAPVEVPSQSCVADGLVTRWRVPERRLAPPRAVARRLFTPSHVAAMAGETERSDPELRARLVIAAWARCPDGQRWVRWSMWWRSRRPANMEMCSDGTHHAARACKTRRRPEAARRRVGGSCCRRPVRSSSASERSSARWSFRMHPARSW